MKLFFPSVYTQHSTLALPSLRFCVHTHLLLRNVANKHTAIRKLHLRSGEKAETWENKLERFITDGIKWFLLLAIVSLHEILSKSAWNSLTHFPKLLNQANTQTSATLAGIKENIGISHPEELDSAIKIFNQMKPIAPIRPHFIQEC